MFQGILLWAKLALLARCRLSTWNMPTGPHCCSSRSGFSGSRCSPRIQDHTCCIRSNTIGSISCAGSGAPSCSSTLSISRMNSTQATGILTPQSRPGRGGGAGASGVNSSSPLAPWAFSLEKFHGLGTEQGLELAKLQSMANQIAAVMGLDLMHATLSEQVRQAMFSACSLCQADSLATRHVAQRVSETLSIGRPERQELATEVMGPTMLSPL